jgi:hypothetical protein
MTPAVVHHHLDDLKEQIRHRAIVLREYAKWSLLRDYGFPPSRESHRQELMQQFLEMGAEVKLTERDMVLMVYRGIFDRTSVPCR